MTVPCYTWDVLGTFQIRPMAELTFRNVEGLRHIRSWLQHVPEDLSRPEVVA